MKYMLLTVLCLAGSISLFAQSNQSLRGKVLYLSSGKSPAVGVEVSGIIQDTEQANTVYSTDAGDYQLVFPRGRAGHPVALTIGDRDARDTQIELVNIREVEECRIPASANEKFEIIVAVKGSRDLVAQRYYKIIKTSADIALEKSRKELNQLFLQQKKDYQKIADLSSTIQELEKKSDSLSIYKEAFRIASINKDKASKRVLNYLQLLDEGKSIQEARGALSIQEASKELSQGLSLFQDAIKELEIRADASYAIYDYDDAITCFDTILTYSERLKINPIQIARQRSKLAMVLMDKGDYHQGKDQVRQALSIQQTVLPAEHLDIGVTSNILGILYAALGYYDSAETYFLQSLPILETKKSYPTAKLMVLYSNIGAVYNSTGRFAEALQITQKAIDKQKGKLQLFEAPYNTKANTFYYMGKYEEAIQLYETSIDLFKKINDPDNPHIAMYYNNLGNVYRDQSNYLEAERFYRLSLDIRKKKLHPKHPLLAESMMNLSSTYFYQGNYEKALELQQKTIAIQEEVLQPRHPNLLKSYENISIYFQNSGLFQQALDYQQKNLKLKEEVLGLDHPDLADTHNNLGFSYQGLQQYDKALEHQLIAANIYEKHLGPNNLKFAIALGNIGNSYYYLKQFDKDLEYQQRCMSIRQAILDSNHVDIGHSHLYLSLAYQGLISYDSALHHVHRAISMYERVLGANHPYRGGAGMIKTSILNGMHAFDEAIHEFKNSEDILKKSYPSDSPMITMYFPEWLGIFFTRAMAAYDQRNYMACLTDLDTVVQQADSTYEHLEKAWRYRCLAQMHIADFANARQNLTEYDSRFPDNPYRWMNWVAYYSIQDQTGQAISHLEEAIESGFNDLDWLESESAFKAIRSEKGYKKVLKALNK